MVSTLGALTIALGAQFFRVRENIEFVQDVIYMFDDPYHEELLSLVFENTASDVLSMYVSSLLQDGYCVNTTDIHRVLDPYANDDSDAFYAASVLLLDRVDLMDSHVENLTACRLPCKTGYSHVTEFGSRDALITRNTTEFGSVNKSIGGGYFRAYAARCGSMSYGPQRNRRQSGPEYSEKEYGLTNEVNGIKAESAEFVRNNNYENITNLFSGSGLPSHAQYANSHEYYTSDTGHQSIFDTFSRAGFNAGLEPGVSGLLAHLISLTVRESESTIRYHRGSLWIQGILLSCFFIYIGYRIYSTCSSSTFKQEIKYANDKQNAEEKEKNKKRKEIISTLAKGGNVDACVLQLKELDGPREEDKLADPTFQSCY